MSDDARISDLTVSYRNRVQIIWFLETASSPAEQREYEKSLRDGGAPGIVPVEMIEMWSDSVRTLGHDYRVVEIERYSEPVFTTEEQNAILRFHDLWNETAENSPDSMPWTIEDLIGTPVWTRFIEGAKEALAVFMKRGHLLEKAKFDPESTS